MNTSKYITRTMSSIKITCTAIDTVTKAVSGYEIAIPDKKYTTAGKEKAVQAALPAGQKLVMIDSETMETELRGMLLSDFIKYSVKMDASAVASNED